MTDYRCLLSPSAPLIPALLALCCLALAAIIVGAVLLRRAWRNLRDMVDTDGLMYVFPEQSDHIRRR